MVHLFLSLFVDLSFLLLSNIMKLKKWKGPEYFEKYFTYTLLEYFGLSYDPIKILEGEQYWKKCFDTIRNGYNDN